MDEAEIHIDQLPLRVTSIQVEGVKHTSPKVPSEYLKILNNCHNFRQLNHSFNFLTHHLMQTGLYKDVHFHVMHANSADGAMEAEGTKSDLTTEPSPPRKAEFNSDVRIFCELTECNRWQGNVGVDQSLDTATATGTMSGKMLNPVVGLGESLQLSLTRDAKGSVSGASLFLRDFFPNMDDSHVRYHAGVERGVVNSEFLSGYTKKQDRVVIGGSTLDHQHTVEYDLAYRSGVPTAQHPTAGIVAQMYQPQFKATIRYIHLKDRRDRAENPRQGDYLRVLGEVSPGVFIGDYSGFKTEFAYQHHTPIDNPSFPLATMSYTLRGGLQQPTRNIWNSLFHAKVANGNNNNNNNNNTTDQEQATRAAKRASLNPNAPPTPPPTPFNPDTDIQDVAIYDRFFAGPNYTRGIASQDYAPHSGRFVYGADAYLTATASASTAIPNYEDLPVRPHVFVNATHMMSISTILKQRYGGKTRGVTDPSQLTASLGFGVVFPTQFGRLEVNVASKVKKFGLTKPQASFSAAIDW